MSKFGGFTCPWFSERGKKQRQTLQLKSGSLPAAVALVWLSEGACLSSFFCSSLPFPPSLTWLGCISDPILPSWCLSLLYCCSFGKEWAHCRNLLLSMLSSWLTFFSLHFRYHFRCCVPQWSFSIASSVHYPNVHSWASFQLPLLPIFHFSEVGTC